MVKDWILNSVLKEYITVPWLFVIKPRTSHSRSVDYAEARLSSCFLCTSCMAALALLTKFWAILEYIELFFLLCLLSSY